MPDWLAIVLAIAVLAAGGYLLHVIMRPERY